MDTKPSGLFKSHPTKPISKLMPTLMAIKKKSRTLKSSLASKVLLCKPKNLCMSPRTHVKKLDIVVHTGKASTGEVGARGSLRSLANEPHCLGSFRTMRDLASKQIWSVPEECHKLHWSLSSGFRMHSTGSR